MDAFESDIEEPFPGSESEYEPDLISSEDSIASHDTTASTEKVLKSRKRSRNEANWKKNVKKTKRAHGQSYLNSKNIVVSEKKFHLFECPCPRTCHSHFPEHQLKKIFESFYKLGNHDLQSSYLNGQISVNEKKRTYRKSVGESRRSKTRTYKFPGENNTDKVVCKEFFKQILQVSDGRITRALQCEDCVTTPKLDQRGRHPPHNRTSVENIEAIKSFIEKFPRYISHYSRNKNINREYLAPELNISILYRLYAKDNPTPVSKFVFTKIFSENFNLHFRAPISDSCRKCDALKAKLESTTDSSQLKSLEIEKELHLRKAEAARACMSLDSKANREDVAVIAFDLMKTLPTPVISTGVAYYKRQLWTYCLGIHDLTTGDAFMYTWNESVASRGPQEIGSCIMHYVKTKVKCKNLIMYSDQCGGQNRNIRMSIICNYMVMNSSYSVDHIDHKFLVSGHSFLPCDQDFGLIEKEKRFYKDIYTPADWGRVILSAKKKKPFHLIEIPAENIKNILPLENKIVNRKVSLDKGKVEWMKIQWLRFEKESPYVIKYKYSNNEEVCFSEVNIAKRNVNLSLNVELEPLYPGGREIQKAKYKDLQDLKQYIPPIYHEFYDNLKYDSKAVDEDIIEDE